MTDPVFHHCDINGPVFENIHIFAQIFSSETNIVIFICKQQRGYIKIKGQYINM